MNNEARQYFGTISKAPNLKYMWIGSWLFGFGWAGDRWTHITDMGTEITHWFRIGKSRNTKGLEVYEFVIGKLLIMCGRRP